MQALKKLLIENRGLGQFKAESGDNEATIYLYDVIVNDDYFGGVSALNFVQTLNEMDADTIHLRINSPGGDVFAARAMEQAIREHPSNIVAHIDGYGASAVTFLMMAADEIRIAEGAQVMIHKAWTIDFGNSDDFLKTAAQLEKIDSGLVNTYASRTGQSPEQIADWMAAETWFDAEEAVEFGFADKIADSSAKAQAWNLSAYEHPPKQPEVETPEEEPTHNTEHMRRRLELVEAVASETRSRVT